MDAMTFTLRPTDYPALGKGHLGKGYIHAPAPAPVLEHEEAA